jgi:hypothetical protein
MHFFQAITLNSLVVLGTLVLLLGPGLCILLPKFRHESPIKILSTSLVITLVILSTALVLAANAGLDVREFLRYLSIFFGVATLIGVLLIGRRSIHIVRELGLPLLVGLIMCGPIVFLTARADLVLGMSSSMNNDIASYSAAAKAFLESGWNDFGKIAGLNINEFVHYSTPFGSTGIMSLVSVAFDIKTFETTLIVISTALLLYVLGAIQLYRAVHLSNKAKFLIPTVLVATCSPILNYVFSNYFLNQIFGISFALLITSSALSIMNKDRVEKLDLLQLSFASAAGVYFYPTLCLPFLVLVFMISTLSWLFKKRDKNSKGYGKFCIALALGLFMTIPYLGISIDIATSQSNAIAGWSLPSLNPFSIFLLPQLIGLEFSGYLVAFSWAFFGTLIYLALRDQIKREKISLVSIGFFLIPLALTIGLMSIKSLGIHEYQAWKSLTFFLPFAVIGVLPHIFGALKQGTLVATVLATIVAIAPITEWTLAQGRSTILNQDLTEIASDPNLAKIEYLNVRLGNYFESMVVSSLLETQKLYFNSFTYWPQTNDANACILVRNDSNYGEYLVSKINDTYSLVSARKGECI